MVNGIESNGVGTAVKHFVANNQETERTLNDVKISERAFREIYLKGFEIIVKESQPWMLMSSYNLVNGTYVPESEYILTDILRNEWGFEGMVVTDWFGGKNPSAMISAGNDLLEPGTNRQWKALTEAAENGELAEADIDRAANRILTLVFKSKKMQDYTYTNTPDLKAHAAITRKSAAEGMVLLKNENALPLAKGLNVALLGTTSYSFIAGGTGSGDVNEAYTVSLEEGLTNAGYQVNEQAKNAFEAHKIANVEGFKKPEGMDVIFNPFSPPEMNYTTQQLEEIAASSDVGILTLGRNAGEGGDRKEVDDFLLTDVEQKIVSEATKAFHAAGKKMLVVLNIGGVIETASWKSQPDGILLAWQGGQEGGNSVADILSGKVNPSGKLPMTFPVNLKDHASHANFPEGGEQWTLPQMLTGLLFPQGERPDDEKVRNRDYTHYDEGVYVGYRHFDKTNMDVSFPFGYGMSYTNFEYGPMETEVLNDTINVTLTVKNIGEVTGKEVVQLYTEKLNSNIDRPTQELKAFTKTRSLAAGEVDSIAIKLPVKELRYWNEENKAWTLEQGAYSIKVGASSRDVRKAAEMTF
jgi:beta-glucosidase